MRTSTPGAPRWQLASSRAEAVEGLGTLTGEPLSVVDLDSIDDDLSTLSTAPAPWIPFIRVGVRRGEVRNRPPRGLDIALTTEPVPRGVGGWVEIGDPDGALASLASRIAAAPDAAVIACQVLRAGEGMSVESALVLESLAYSTLQSGPAFARWLASAAPIAADREPPETDAVIVERLGHELVITLNRPACRNALNVRMRDELAAALEVACLDPTVEAVHLRGNGASFSSGGELADFGTSPDPATAHLVRTARSPAGLLAAIAGRSTAHLHGACVGAGIELAAFCTRVAAAPDTWIKLPELGFGLIPGAGGTVSIPRRIGRQRAAWLALSGEVVGAPLARLWGLVDLADDPGPAFCP